MIIARYKNSCIKVLNAFAKQKSGSLEQLLRSICGRCGVRGAGRIN